jgi:predicted acetyltransferase
MAENARTPLLVELNAELKDEFLAMAREFRSAGEDRFSFGLDNFEKLLEQLEMYRTGNNLPEGHVRSNTFFLLDGNRLLGSGSLRHRLSASLAVYGGHIGYDVRPSERRKGYGSMILRLVLEKARAIGLERVFLTCDTENATSARIIEKHGGRLENRIFYEPIGKLISQYWIELK